MQINFRIEKSAYYILLKINQLQNIIDIQIFDCNYFLKLLDYKHLVIFK